MKKTLISIAAIVALSAGVAHAGNNNGPVFGGTQNYTTTNNTTNAPVANGGVGHGGDASAVGVATGEELMCSLAKYREARKSAGRPCNADKKAAATAGAQQTAAFEHTDPIVRARIGLPPLSK